MIKRGPVGDYDDDQLSDDELLYRRVPDKPDHLETVDLVTGKPRPTPAAFSYSGNGLSVFIHGLIRRHGLKTCDLCKDWSTHGVARFQARHVRPQAGVIEDPTEDPLIGLAHPLWTDLWPMVFGVPAGLLVGKWICDRKEREQ